MTFKIGDEVFLTEPRIIDDVLITTNDVGHIVDAHDRVADYWFVSWDQMVTREHTTPASWFEGGSLIEANATDYTLTAHQERAILKYEKDREDLESKQE